MSRTPVSTVCVSANFSSNTTTELKNSQAGVAGPQRVSGVGLDAGGRITVEAGTPTVSVIDANGHVLVSQALTSAGLVIDPTARGIHLPLSATVTGHGGTIVVYWYVKR